MISRIALAAALTLALPALAQAQDASQTEAAEDIVVTGKFIDPGTGSAMKMDISVLDTPFTVASYSETFVESLETTSVSDLYNYMTGVKKAGNTGYDITLRGFKSGGDDRNAIMVDGLPGLTGRFGSPPTIGVERVEIVKGPMSMLYGAIQPGGFVNMISKKPQANAATEIQLRGNSFWGGGRDLFDKNGVNIAIDSTGSLVGDGALLYRVVAEYNDRKGFRDFTFNRGPYVAPSLAWNIGEDTTLTLLGEYRKTREAFDTQLVAPRNDVSLLADITTRYQEPDDFRIEEGLSGTVLFNHNFGGGIKLNVGYRHVDYDSDQKEFSVVAASGLGAREMTTAAAIAAAGGQFRVERRARHLQTHRTYDYGDVNISANFETGSIEHKLLVGINGGKDLVNEDRLKFFNSNTRNATTGLCRGIAGNTNTPTCLDIDAYNPVYGQVPSFDSLPAINPALAGQASGLTNRFVKSSNYGIYLSDLVTLSEQLKVFFGGRNFSETQEIEADRRNAPGVIARKKAKKSFLPSGGILFQPASNLTIYASYSESFVPVDAGARDITGANPFNPVEGTQYEAGIKAENLLDGALNATLSLFHITQKGILNTFSGGTCPATVGTCSEQVGEARSKGIELETNITPFDGMQIIAGYAFIDAEITKSLNAYQVGARLANTAKHSGNLWARYDWKNGLGVGLGVTYTGKRAGRLPPSATDLAVLELAAYTVVDAGIYYTLNDNVSFNLKAGNIFNKRYLESAGFTPQIQFAPGAPRNLTLSSRFKF